jgi:hypothetical protein
MSDRKVFIDRLTHIVDEMVETASGRVKFADSAYEHARSALTKAQTTVSRGHVEFILSQLERVESRLDGTEDWAGSKYGNALGFTKFVNDLRETRDLTKQVDLERHNARVAEVKRLVRELLGLKPV